MLVKDVMIKEPITLSPNEPIVDAIRKFKKEKISGAPVVEEGKLVGLLTNEQILKFMEVHEFGAELILPSPFDVIEVAEDLWAEIDEAENEFSKLKHNRVKDIMDKSPVTAKPEMHVTEAADIMSKKKLTHLPVVENGKLLGLVTRADLTKTPLP
ncbi:MAG: CBS domain-containing protein [Candidatus Diapherotrites archaeon]|nr:CBS domain-containing protein [Candidatus Diapherotrites archaeon]